MQQDGILLAFETPATRPPEAVKKRRPGKDLWRRTRLSRTTLDSCETGLGESIKDSATASKEALQGRPLAASLSGEARRSQTIFPGPR